MTKAQQETFITELIRNVEKDLLARVPKLPDEWDGHELRQLIADRFQEVSFTLKQNKSRYRAYKNEVLVRDL
jgi:hypothetical protein